MSSEIWDQRYAAEDYVYGTLPEHFFRQEIDLLKPGRILLPAEGEGRNAVYAAQLGWKVLAFDQSAEGKRKALRLAAEKGVKIEYLIQDLETINCPVDYFDSIALSFVHTPANKRQAIHRHLVTFLKPGGILILQGFSTEQGAYDSGGPKDPGMLFTPEALNEDFSGLKIHRLEKLLVDLDSGEGHRGPGSVIRLVAEKKR